MNPVDVYANVPRKLSLLHPLFWACAVVATPSWEEARDIFDIRVGLERLVMMKYGIEDIRHFESGRLLAEHWELTPDLVEVVSHHHFPERAKENAGLVALVQLADLLCRMSGLNYGYAEQRQVSLMDESGFPLLEKYSSKIRDFDWARLTFELDSYMDDVHSLVRAIYRA